MQFCTCDPGPSVDHMKSCLREAKCILGICLLTISVAPMIRASNHRILNTVLVSFWKKNYKPNKQHNKTTWETSNKWQSNNDKLIILLCVIAHFKWSFWHNLIANPHDNLPSPLHSWKSHVGWRKKIWVSQIILCCVTSLNLLHHLLI